MTEIFYCCLGAVLALLFDWVLDWTHHCRRCRWWEPHGEYEGFCRLSGCYVPSLIEFMKVKPRDGGLSDPGRANLWAKHDQVRTSPDFGCNQWEAKGGC